MQFVYCYCVNCKHMFSGPRPPMLLPESDYDDRGAFGMAERSCCSTPSCTPPIIVFVPPFRPPRAGESWRTPRRGYDYDADLNRALSESFEEDRDVEPKPASERTLQAIASRREPLPVDATCGICLDTIIAGQSAVVAGCCKAHAHPECMEKALLATPRCPFCRFSADD